MHSWLGPVATYNPPPILAFAMNRNNNAIDTGCERKLPAWVVQGASTWGEPVNQPEWDEDEPLDGQGSCEESDPSRGQLSQACYRRDSGWLGSDMCHSFDSSVRCSHYRIKYPTVDGGVDTTLTGVAHFTRG